MKQELNEPYATALPQQATIEDYLRSVLDPADYLSEDTAISSRIEEMAPGAGLFTVELPGWDVHKVYQTLLGDLDDADFVPFKGWKMAVRSVSKHNDKWEPDTVTIRCRPASRHASAGDYFAQFDRFIEVVELSGDDGDQIVLKLDEGSSLPDGAVREAWVRGLVFGDEEVVEGTRFLTLDFF